MKIHISLPTHPWPSGAAVTPHPRAEVLSPTSFLLSTYLAMLWSFMPHSPPEPLDPWVNECPLKPPSVIRLTPSQEMPRSWARLFTLSWLEDAFTHSWMGSQRPLAGAKRKQLVGSQLHQGPKDGDLVLSRLGGPAWITQGLGSFPGTPFPWEGQRGCSGAEHLCLD